MRKNAPIRGTLLLLWLCALSSMFALSQTLGRQSLEQIVSRMQSVQREARNNPEYRLLREYKLSVSGADTPSSQVLAEIKYIPPGSKQFSIKQVQGNERGGKIVRKVLEHEVQMASHSDAFELTPGNYDFSLLREDVLRGRRCYLLQLSPKRNATELLRGKAWVDEESFLVLRVEGEPAKNPSWWVKNLYVGIDYGLADGMWLPLTTRATAELRLLGPHVLTSEDLQVRAIAQNAAVVPAESVLSHKRGARNSLSTAGVWLPQ